MRLLWISISFFSLSLYAQDTGVVLTLSVDEPSIYVNAQAIVTVELKSPVSLRNGSLTKPEPKDAIVELMVEDDRSERSEHGVHYQVFKKIYAIFPTKAGVLQIPAIVFDGVLAVDSGSSWPGFFSTGKRISLRSNALVINVKDKPSSYPSDQPFLPLKSFTIIESFDEPQAKFEVNKATTRRFEIRALGALASFLPTLNPPRLAGMQIYTEAGEKIQKNTAEGLMASTTFSHVYLPSEPGAMQIPEQTIYWWDTDTDTLKTTVLRAIDISVEGQAQATPPAPPTAEAPPEVKNSVSQAPSSSQSYFWPMLAALFFSLWLISLIVIFVKFKTNKKLNSQKINSVDQELFEHINNIKTSCDQQNAKEALTRMLILKQWLKRRSKLEHEAEFNACMLNLEQVLYRQKDPAALTKALQHVKSTVEAARDRKNPAALPQLYPL